MWEKYEHHTVGQVGIFLVFGLVMKPCLPRYRQNQRVVMLFCSSKYI